MPKRRLPTVRIGQHEDGWWASYLLSRRGPDYLYMLRVQYLKRLNLS